MIRSFSKCATFALAAALLFQSVAQAYVKPQFPRLGGYLIGSPQNYDDPNYQANIARLHVVILNVWQGWTGSTPGNTNISQVLQNIKARNPLTQTFLYMDINESQQQDVIFGSVLSSNNWWLYGSGTSGAPVKSTWGNDFYTVNTTAFNSAYLDWRSNYQYQTFVAPSAAYLDGLYTDNVFSRPRVDGDWDRDGVTDSQYDPTVQGWFRQGFRSYFNKLKTLMPAKYQLGNIGAFGTSSQIPEYDGLLNGGVMEGTIGFSWSTESWGSWQQMMAEYRTTMARIAEPKLVIFHQDGNPSDYQAFRYGFASCLLDDAYYYFSANDNYSGVNWFDEFNASLGPATSSPAMTQWQSGVYRRDFQNGIVLVNPKGNGARQVFLEGEYYKLNGTQAPGVNNGQIVRSVTLQDRDGIVLMRSQAQMSTTPATPAAPATTNPTTPAATKTPAAPAAISIR
jgi:hypothetical protein